MWRRGASADKRGVKCKNALPNSPISRLNSRPPYVPPADEREWQPFVMATDKQCWTMILSDIHFPYHDKTALEVMLKEGKRRKVKKIILNGDQLDCHWQSKFDKDPQARSFVEELETARAFLEGLRETFGDDCEIVWKNGNHDERHEKFLAQHAMVLFKMREVQLDNLLQLFDLRIAYVTDKRPIHLGKLPVLHGHEYGEQILAPVNPARGLFLKTKWNAMCGHLHQTSEHTETDVLGKMVTCWSVACLCQLHPKYRPFNKWNHGGALVELMPSGEFNVENKRILHGKML